MDSSVAITMCAHTSLGTQPIYLFGSQEQKERMLPRSVLRAKLGAFGLTEPEAGSDAGNVRTRAHARGRRVGRRRRQAVHHQRRYRHLRRTWPSAARTGEGEISNIIVANGTAGYERATPYRKMGWNASDTRPLTFTDCRVPEENLLGPRGQGFKQFLHILDIGRIGVAAMGVGLAQGALDEALAYAKERRAFGQPISKFQAIQGKLADMATEIEARACSPTRPRSSRTRAATSRSPPRRRSSRPGGWPCAAPRRPCRSTVATATSRSTPCAASTATPRSSRSARAPTRSSRWSSRARSAPESRVVHRTITSVRPADG